VFSSGAYAAVVAIERASGRLRVLRMAAVDDAGTIVNPLLAEGQVLGGTAQGLGECLLEEALYDEEGQFTSASFLDYSLMTAAEMPPVAAAFVESPSPLNPLGAKGIGEGGAIGTPAAVGNAVATALGGASLDPPWTEDKLWRALQGRPPAAVPRVDVVAAARPVAERALVVVGALAAGALAVVLIRRRR
jgi:carbon-monoxide dehydrogenase large subunit